MSTAHDYIRFNVDKSVQQSQTPAKLSRTKSDASVKQQNFSELIPEHPKLSPHDIGNHSLNILVETLLKEYCRDEKNRFLDEIYSDDDNDDDVNTDSPHTSSQSTRLTTTQKKQLTNSIKKKFSITRPQNHGIALRSLSKYKIDFTTPSQALIDCIVSILAESALDLTPLEADPERVMTSHTYDDKTELTIQIGKYYFESTSPRLIAHRIIPYRRKWLQILYNTAIYTQNAPLIALLAFSFNIPWNERYEKAQEFVKLYEPLSTIQKKKSFLTDFDILTESYHWFHKSLFLYFLKVFTPFQHPKLRSAELYRALLKRKLWSAVNWLFQIPSPNPPVFSFQKFQREIASKNINTDVFRTAIQNHDVKLLEWYWSKYGPATTFFQKNADYYPHRRSPVRLAVANSALTVLHSMVEHGVEITDEYNTIATSLYEGWVEKEAQVTEFLLQYPSQSKFILDPKDPNSGSLSAVNLMDWALIWNSPSIPILHAHGSRPTPGFNAIGFLGTGLYDYQENAPFVLEYLLEHSPKSLQCDPISDFDINSIIPFHSAACFISERYSPSDDDSVLPDPFITDSDDDDDDDPDEYDSEDIYENQSDFEDDEDDEEDEDDDGDREDGEINLVEPGDYDVGFVHQFGADAGGDDDHDDHDDDDDDDDDMFGDDRDQTLDRWFFLTDSPTPSSPKYRISPPSGSTFLGNQSVIMLNLLEWAILQTNIDFVNVLCKAKPHIDLHTRLTLYPRLRTSFNGNINSIHNHRNGLNQMPLPKPFFHHLKHNNLTNKDSRGKNTDIIHLDRDVPPGNRVQILSGNFGVGDDDGDGDGNNQNGDIDHDRGDDFDPNNQNNLTNPRITLLPSSPLPPPPSSSQFSFIHEDILFPDYREVEVYVKDFTPLMLIVFSPYGHGDPEFEYQDADEIEIDEIHAAIYKVESPKSKRDRFAVCAIEMIIETFIQDLNDDDYSSCENLKSITKHHNKTDSKHLNHQNSLGKFQERPRPEKPDLQVLQNHFQPSLSLFAHGLAFSKFVLHDTYSDIVSITPSDPKQQILSVILLLAGLFFVPSILPILMKLVLICSIIFAISIPFAAIYLQRY